MVVAEEKFPTLGIQGVDELVTFYQEYDREISELRSKNGFYCLPGCGACCYVPSSKIEVVVFEMIPLAIKFVMQGKGEELIQQLENEDVAQIPCVMYCKNSDDGRLGYCSEYSLRPLICRLFGGGSRIKRNDTRELYLCKLLKEEYRINQDLLDKLSYEFPVSSDVSTYVRGLNLSMDQEFLPINVALKKALEYVMFRIQWLNPEPPVLTPHNGMDHAA